MHLGLFKEYSGFKKLNSNYQRRRFGKIGTQTPSIIYSAHFLLTVDHLLGALVARSTIGTPLDDLVKSFEEKIMSTRIIKKTKQLQIN